MPHFGEGVGGRTIDEYIVGKVGSNRYGVWDETGVRRHLDTGLVAAIQWAHDQLTSGGSIGIKFDDYYTNEEWEAELDITNPGIHLHGNVIRYSSGVAAEFPWLRASDSLNAPMINIAANYCSISWLSLDANYGGAKGAGAHGIWNHGTACHLFHVSVTRAQGYGIYWGGGLGLAEACMSQANPNWAWYISGNDVKFIGCKGSDSYNGWRITSSATSGLGALLIGCIADTAHSGVGYGVGFNLYGCNKSILKGCQAHYNKKEGFLLEGASYNMLIGCAGDQNCDEGNNTYDQMRLQSKTGVHCIHNIIVGLQLHSTRPNKPRYGIYEADANQDYNIFGDCQVGNCVTDTILTQGVNSIEHDNIEY